ncbi:MAG: 5-(carboxyamino)imidazole ribonucleotide mutase [Candidatus Marinimicrobia bacterium]|nr:5-(carboxyamino)imidazole ribonucleotide mutase [Candidatus Neomarinimicrobiota bacterium]
MKIAIISGSPSDKSVIEAADPYIEYFGLHVEKRILSAHRNPKELATFIKEFEESDGRIFIGVAGMAAHLPGVIASHTSKPVLGVPVEGPSLAGFDSLLSIVQMPKGIPVATFAVGKAGMINAIIFAAQIFAGESPEMNDKVKAFKAQGSKLN